MAAHLIDGKAIAGQINSEVQSAVAELVALGRQPRLVAILVGDAHASYIYADNQRKRCRDVGIEYELVHFTPAHLEQFADAQAIQNRLLGEIRRLNADLSVTGIMLHLPLPPGVDAARLQFEIDPFKDVEGVNPANLGFIFYDQPLLLPCTALAAVEIAKRVGVPIRGAEAVVVGQSSIVGRPIAALLTRELATVTGCHVATVDLPAHTRRADLLFTAVGKPGLIRGDMVKPQATVIDIAINRVQDTLPDGTTHKRTVGDCAADVADVAGNLTPVPGGVGPVTVAMLMRNTVEAVRKQIARGG